MKTFDKLFAKLKRTGQIPSDAKPATYRLFWLAAKGLISSVAVLLQAQDFSTASVGLTWTPNTEPDIAGYRIHYSTGTNAPLIVQVASNVNSVTITNIPYNTPYAYYATAFNTRGMESDPSESITYSVPIPISLTTPTEKQGFAVRTIPQQVQLLLQWYPVPNATEYTVVYNAPGGVTMESTTNTSTVRTFAWQQPIQVFILASNSVYRVTSQPLSIIFKSPLAPGGFKKL